LRVVWPFVSGDAFLMWAVALACLLRGAAPALAQPVSYQVEIEAPKRLTEVLRANLDLVRWSARGDITEDQLRQLVATASEQARNLLATEGYFTPEVQTELTRANDGWLARMKVDPGEPTQVVSLDLRLRGPIEADAARDERLASARDAFELKPGQIFRQADWDAAKRKALQSVQQRRYATARIVNSRAAIDPESRAARLEVEIDSGPPFVFGELNIAGLDRYPPSIVRNLSPIRSGEPYDEQQMLDFQRRLLTVGQFASAVVAADVDPAKAPSADVRVAVVEAEAREIELGAGYSTDRGARFQAGYLDHNTFGRAWRLNSLVKIDQLSEEVVGGLTFPRNEKGWRYGMEGRYNNQDIQGEQRTDWSVTGAHTYTVEKYESQQSLQLLEERQQLADGTQDSSRALFAAQTWTWNWLDDLILPSRGQLLRMQLGGASRSLGSDQNFVRLHGRGLYMRPVGGFGTLTLRLEAGAVHAGSRAGIPSAYLFRTGGDTSVRGYAFESLGVPEGGAIVGGRFMAAGGVEYTQWLLPQWGAAVFYDAGDAVDRPADFRAAAGYGVGARWRSPVGTLSLDVAYGEETDEVRLHFTVGLILR
jgi:translocation and assembly module TamA